MILNFFFFRNQGGMYSMHMSIILIYIRYELYIILNGRVVGLCPAYAYPQSVTCPFWTIFLKKIPPINQPAKHPYPLTS
jgi:hypothetical protein